MKSSNIPVRRSSDEQANYEATFKDVFEHGFGFNEVIGLKVEFFAPESPRLKFDMRPELLGSYIHKRLHGGVIATALDRSRSVIQRSTSTFMFRTPKFWTVWLLFA